MIGLIGVVLGLAGVLLVTLATGRRKAYLDKYDPQERAKAVRSSVLLIKCGLFLGGLGFLLLMLNPLLGIFGLSF